jgi:hypothetical protein
MRNIIVCGGIAVGIMVLAGIFFCQGDKAMDKASQAWEQVHKWKIHDPDRPQPSAVDPGSEGTPVSPPSDSIVLFDGKDLSRWEDKKGQPARWKVENGYMEVVKKTGDIRTKQEFGDCQIHVEWSAPVVIEGGGQDRGNSGVFLMGLYEIQVLDCYQNQTYPDGMTAAVYGQYPPLVNACRPPGEWQAYDIIFHRPRYGSDGNLIRPATVTVFFNGILVQDNVVLTGPTDHKTRLPYKAHEDKLPLMLQDHGNPVRYRNIWIRDLPESKE